MPPRSSNFVKFTSVDPAVVVAALRKWSDGVVARRPEILAIGYFGSYATGRYSPGSDLDVLVIASTSPHRRFFDRSPELYPDSFPVGMDLFVYTVGEVRAMKAASSFWMAHILTEVVWVREPAAGLLGGRDEPQAS